MFKIERPQSDYTTVCNAVLRDKRLSLRAKGLYALMYSKPDDWIFYEDALVAESSEGRDAVRAAMKELVGLGWMSKAQPRDGGKFSGNTYKLHLTADWKSGDGKTGDGETATTKTERSKTEEVRKVRKSKSPSVMAFTKPQPTDGVSIASVLVDGLPPDDWVKMAAMMHRMPEAAAWKQARKCVWYYTEGPGKDVRRRPDQWSQLFLKFFAPKRRAA